MSSDSKKVWERPWTTEEIIEQAENWSLACDAALLNTLKSFGDKILQKSEDVYKRVENLCDDLKEANLRLELTRNEFNSLRNTQFVECRVYEEDETLLTGQQDKEPENNVPKEETMDDLKEAVALGLEILDKYYDTVKVTVSDSEDEDEDIPSYVYRRKDPYINRPLPYLIGSEQWHKKWHVGLLETDSENEKSSSDKFSDSESEDNFQATKDHSDVSSDLFNFSGSNNLKGEPAAVSSANTTQHDALSSASEQAAEEIPTSKSLSFAEQLTAKLGNVIKEKEALLEEPEVNRRPIQKKPSDYGALFSDEPPPLDDMPQSESQGIFSGGKGLFDDDEEDDSLWNPGKPSSANNRSGPSISSKIVQSKGLFDEESDDDIFPSSKKSNMKNQLTQPYLQSQKIETPLFSEEPPLLEDPKSPKEKRKPTGGVSIFGDANIFQNNKIVSVKRISTSSESSEDDTARTKIVEEGPKPSKTSILTEKETFSKDKNLVDQNKRTISSVPKSEAPIEQKLSDVKIENLFQNDETPPPATEKTFKPKKSGLFDDDEEIPSVNEDPSKPKKRGLFDDDLFGGDLFSGSKFSTNLFSKGGLFSDDEADEFVAPKLKPPSGVVTVETAKVVEQNQSKENSAIVGDDVKSLSAKPRTKIVSLFDDVEDDDDFNIFKPKITRSTTKIAEKLGGIEDFKEDLTSKENKSTNEIKRPAISLFNDDFEDPDDLFSEILQNDWIHKKSLNVKESIRASSTPELVEKPKVEVEKIESRVDEKPINIQQEVMDAQSLPESTNLDSQKIYNSGIFDENMAFEIKKEKEESCYNDNSINFTGNNAQNSQNPLAEENSMDSCSTDHTSPQLLKDDVGSISTNPPPTSRNSISVPHVSFLDSMPPLDDTWENGSDNAFDDLEPYENDDFQSQPSSLFDNEPPSLFFNDTSGILSSRSNRLDSMNSFATPTATSSRRLSSDIFSDSQNNNSLFLTKNHDSDNVAVQPNLQIVPEISYSHSDNTDITPSGNLEEIYSPLVTGDTKFYGDGASEPEECGEEKVAEWNRPKPSDFANTLSESADSFDSLNNNKFDAKPPVSKKKPSVEKMSKQVSKKNESSGDPLKNQGVSSDVPDKVDILDKDEISDSTNTKQIFPDKVSDLISEKDIGDKNGEGARLVRKSNGDERCKSGGVSEGESEDMQNNIARIAEKLQKQVVGKDEEKAKPLVSPRKIAHNLNINVGALLPGAAPPKRDKTLSPDSSPEQNKLYSSLPASKLDVKEETTEISRTSAPIMRAVSESGSTRKEYKLEKSVSFDGSAEIEVLQSVTKDRARIPVKRKPSTRRARQSLRNSIPDFNLIRDYDQETNNDAPSSLVDDSDQISNTQHGSTSECKPDITSTGDNEIEEQSSLLDESEDLFKSRQEQIESVISAKLVSAQREPDEGGDLLETKLPKPKETVETSKAEVIDARDAKNTTKKLEDTDIFSEINNSPVSSNGRLFPEKDLNEQNNEEKSQKDRQISTNLFDSSDDSDDFLKDTKTKFGSSKGSETAGNKDENGQRQKTKSTKGLFDSSEDDDDFLQSLGAVKGPKDKKASSITKNQEKITPDNKVEKNDGSSSSKTKQDIETSVISKKPPKSSSLRKLENIEGDEDPLSALLNN